MTPVSSLPQAMAYANWEFDVPWLEDLSFDLEIVRGDEAKPGRFFQLNDFKIGSLGSYVGLQSDLYQPAAGMVGKGLLFSQWGTNNSSNTAIEPTGYTQIAREGDPFTGVRNRWNWTLGRYTATLRQSKPDDGIGRWYELHVKSMAGEVEGTTGSIRFPKVNGMPPLIQSGGGTWLEAYGDPRHARNDEDVPRTELVIHRVTANQGTLKPSRVRVNYNDKFPAANVDITPAGPVKLLGGKGVTRTTRPATYPLSW